MKKEELNYLLNNYHQLLIASGKTKASADSRKRDLKIAVLRFDSKKKFDEAISNNASLSKLIKELKNLYDTKKVYSIKNAISCYAKLVLNKSIFTEEKVIEKALLDFSKAVQKFDEIAEFDTANIVGEYGEYYICKKFNLDRALTNSKSIDATFVECGVNKRVQIKARWYRGSNFESSNNEFGAIVPNDIDYFVGVIFGLDFKPLKTIVMNKKQIELYFAEHNKNKRVIIYKGAFEKESERYCLKSFNNKNI